MKICSGWKRISLLTIFYIADFSVILAQPDYITGRNIDSFTSEPVPFVTIRLKNNHIGVFANADGMNTPERIE